MNILTFVGGELILGHKQARTSLYAKRRKIHYRYLSVYREPVYRSLISTRQRRWLGMDGMNPAPPEDSVPYFGGCLRKDKIPSTSFQGLCARGICMSRPFFFLRATNTNFFVEECNECNLCEHFSRRFRFLSPPVS